MGAQSFSKSGHFVPAKLKWSPGEYGEVLRSVVEKVVPQVKGARVYLCAASPDGTCVHHHVESLEEVPQISELGRYVESVEMTVEGTDGRRCSLLVRSSETFWYVWVDVDRLEDLNLFWVLLEARFGLRERQAADECQGPLQADGPPSLLPSKVQVYCKPKDITWPVVPELPARLAKLGFEVKEKTVRIERYPTVAEYRTLEGALKDVETNRAPKEYEISLAGSATGTRLSIWRYSNLSGQELLRVEFTGKSAEEVVGKVISFLGLEPDQAAVGNKRLERTCFVGYRFDDQGHELAERLCRFLRLLRFTISTGREFAPRSISEKVRARMAQQSIVFAILTAGEDKTWLVQESLLGESSGKSLFLLKEKGYTHSGALLADKEYIPFEAPHIEATFVQVLEGLRELGFGL